MLDDMIRAEIRAQGVAMLQDEVRRLSAENQALKRRLADVPVEAR